MSQEESQVFRSGSHEEAAAAEGRNKKKKAKQEGPTDTRHLHDEQDGPSDRREMHDADGPIDGHAEYGTDSVEDLLAWAGVQGSVNPRNMQDAEGPSNKRSMQDGDGPSDQRSLQDHYATIDSKTGERRTVELGKRIDPSMADPQQAAAQVKKEPLFTMADATPWALSLRLEARLKDVGSKTSELHNQIDRLEVDALNLGKRIKI